MLMRCHTNDSSLVWDWKAHDEMSDAFADVAGDREHQGPDPHRYRRELQRRLGPGSGGRHLDADVPRVGDEAGLYTLDEKAWYGRSLIENALAVEVPVISVVNGPCNIHSEIPLLGDIVLASEDAYFQDLAHFPRGIVPGDGQHVIWNFIVGHNRGRYFLLTGMELTAQQALEWGAVAEVLPKETVLDRAWELAREIAKRPPLTLRYTRLLFTQELKRAFLNELNHGLARETYAQRAFFPFGGGMAPLDRAWDDNPWSS